MEVKTDSSSVTTRAWLEPCPNCGAMGELRPCDSDCLEPLGFCRGCQEWWIGRMEIDWGDWERAYRERSRG